MKTTKKSLLAAGISTVLLASFNVSAKVLPEQAEKLGKELTPVGAIAAGNAEGTIPAWNPDFQPPADYKGTGSRYVDPYKDEKPLFTITAANVQQYKGKLSPGQVKMFEAYPDTFRMDVFPSHRDGSYTDFVNENTIRNATRAELAADGNGVVNAFGGAAFPMPNNGVEAIWNSGQAGEPIYYKRTYDDILVYKDGTQIKGTATTERLAAFFDSRMNIAEFKEGKHPRLYYMTQIHAPTRDKGSATLVYSPVNPSIAPQSAWTYSPGVRRVRRAPTVAYDSFEGLGKFRTVDSGSGFNGATDKYDWKLVGKRELYIPYNNYKFDSADADYKELFPAGHANPDYVRYELHRVWEVEATLKEGERNVFRKRVVYMDEDSWTISVADMYDNREKLWRVILATSINKYDVPGVAARSYMQHDLLSKEYAADRLTNGHPLFPINDETIKEISYFKPASLRKLGVR
ncbi:DUF1329 domain-containing protein [Endozoicomonas sp. OPT23]|uniref:DUF1329 domain-containing protein n=1 Tax=Endozoicomonas sp. OPT23 TaxID=2072845 RepID=UPI00129B08F3|nr:DUF1329 domain-containing protein [Endozoicomonas sp. OPT23]MRI33825.1 DUF1329 domain-containing protein [Endozoicomonas sp. OPT23]